MPTYKPCDQSVADLAAKVLKKHESHAPLVKAKLKVDLVFAYADCDENNQKVGSALKLRGITCRAIARIINLKDRAKGQGDVEVCIDGDWWPDVDEREQEALLDHELHHFQVKTSKNGTPLTDDLMRPIIKMRKHDVEFGWFKIVAARNGQFSLERIQAGKLMEESGQFFWPSIAGLATRSRISNLELHQTAHATA